MIIIKGVGVFDGVKFIGRKILFMAPKIHIHCNLDSTYTTPTFGCLCYV